MERNVRPGVARQGEAKRRGAERSEGWLLEWNPGRGGGAARLLSGGTRDWGRQ